MDYKTQLMSVDPEIDQAFNEKIQFIKDADSIKENRTHVYYIQPGFNNLSALAIQALLNQYKTNIRVVENMIAQFCHNKTQSIIDDFYSTYAAIVTQSSTYVGTGEEVEIIAGVGSISKRSKPLFIIDGKRVSMNDDGLAIYKIISSDKPGTYNVPVSISFINQETGTMDTIRKVVQYTVRK